jgi:hypothetical protein
VYLLEVVIYILRKMHGKHSIKYYSYFKIILLSIKVRHVSAYTNKSYPYEYINFTKSFNRSSEKQLEVKTSGCDSILRSKTVRSEV